MFAMDPGELDGDGKVGDERSSSSPKLDTMADARVPTMRRADTSLQERFLSTGRTSTTLLQRSNSSTERSQRSSLQTLGLSSPTTRSRQNSAFIRTQTSPSSPRTDLLARPHSPHPRSPCALPPEVSLPESGRASPKARSAAGYSTLQRGGTYLKKGRLPILKKGSLLFLLLLFVWFTFDWWYLSRFQPPSHRSANTSTTIQGQHHGSSERVPHVMYERLLALAAHGLAENEFKEEPDDLWEEPSQDSVTWVPCANQRPEGHLTPPTPEHTTGYIMISATGGLNQQRVAVCNAVAVARMLNATLILPRFSFNSVWRDSSQFGDMYDESYFIDYLKEDVHIVKDLPIELQSLDLNAMESVVTEFDVPKEAKPSFYLTHILPLLLRNRVVLFEGFGNRLAFDPVQFDIQRLRCRCNFHALRFLPNLQDLGLLIAQRMRENHPRWGPTDDDFNIDENSHLAGAEKIRIQFAKSPPKYLALHMRFEVDMAAYSLCDFGGGEAEREELRAYRAIHFPILAKLEKAGKIGSAALQREMGHCPLMPEEGFLMLAALGFKRGTRIYLAGAHIYGGEKKMPILRNLFPNLVTKEDILTAAELEPYRNYSSQLAVLDYLGCAFSDIFAMTDSGSQLSSLVAGYRIYNGAGRAPTIRPNKKRLASIFEDNSTIEWSHFEERVRKTVKETKKIAVRPVSRSVYRHPRCPECMCKHED